MLMRLNTDIYRIRYTKSSRQNIGDSRKPLMRRPGGVQQWRKYLSRAKGINTALDIVEEALISLQEKAKQQPVLPGSSTDSHCIRNSPQPSTSDAHQKTAKKVKTSGVLIKRQPRSRSRNLRTGSHHPSGKRKVKTKKKQDISAPKIDNPNENLSSSSDDTPRRSRSQQPRSRQEPLRPRSKRGNENVTQKLPCESTHCSIIDNSTHNPAAIYRSSKRQGSRGSSHIVGETSEDEILPGRRYKSTRRSNSRARLLPTGKGVDKPSHGYAAPTLTSRLRTELLERREAEEKENLIPFIPSGSENKSFHLGVIIQKELGRLKNIPPKELENAKAPQQCKPGNKSSISVMTEEAVKLAMQNIEKEITAVTKQISNFIQCCLKRYTCMLMFTWDKQVGFGPYFCRYREYKDL
nr:uncharacterized protein LOC113805730 [Penaeus vannamei]